MFDPLETERVAWSDYFEARVREYQGAPVDDWLAMLTFIRSKIRAAEDAILARDGGETVPAEKPDGEPIANVYGYVHEDFTNSPFGPFSAVFNFGPKDREINRTIPVRAVFYLRGGGGQR